MEYRYSPAVSTVQHANRPSALATAKDVNAVPVPFVIRGGVEYEQNSGKCLFLKNGSRVFVTLTRRARRQQPFLTSP
jgi:hypothetical protein